MTEITGSTASWRGLLWQGKPRRKVFLIDPVAFVVALLAAPLAVGILGFWAIVPILAIPFGAATYLTFGAAFFAIAITRAPLNDIAFWQIGILAHLASIIVAPLVFRDMALGIETVPFFTLMGLLFAPLWALAFGRFYRRLARPFYKHAH
ncbi:MAG: hypothetical protein AAGF74_15150 [Pseudomonadota bacterium]